jgi:hypothetical protein
VPISLEILRLRRSLWHQLDLRVLLVNFPGPVVADDHPAAHRGLLGKKVVAMRA